VKINGITNDEEYKFLTYLIPNHKEDVDQKKIQKVKIMNYSPTNWMLSPPTINHIIKLIEKDVAVYIKFKWEFIREFPVNNKNIKGVSKVLLKTNEVNILRDIISSIKKEKKESIKSPIKNSKLVLNGN